MRIRESRLLLGLSQQHFAEMIGVTYQQAYKYEHGINRVSAARLFEIASALRTPIEYFYEGFGKATLSEPLQRRHMALEIARHVSEIPDQKLQAVIAQLTRILADRS
jgi:transcriptional regulator with XRE-family HTH domain